MSSIGFFVIWVVCTFCLSATTRINPPLSRFVLGYFFAFFAYMAVAWWRITV